MILVYNKSIRKKETKGLGPERAKKTKFPHTQNLEESGRLPKGDNERATSSKSSFTRTEENRDFPNPTRARGNMDGIEDRRHGVALRFSQREILNGPLEVS